MKRKIDITSIRNLELMIARQRALRTIDEEIDAYVEFVKKTLEAPGYLELLSALRPFEGVAACSMEVESRRKEVLNMGIEVLLMSSPPRLFSMGVTIEVRNSVERSIEGCNSTITSCKALDELQDYVATPEFRNEALKRMKNHANTVLGLPRHG